MSDSLGPDLSRFRARPRKPQRPQAAAAASVSSLAPSSVFTAPEDMATNTFISETDESALALERDWYAGDDSERAAGDDFHDPFAWSASAAVNSAAPAPAPSRRSAREAQWKRDNDTWEANRMLGSGIAQRARAMEEEDDEESRVHVLTHELRPPFLDGRTVFTTQLEPVKAVRDPNGDMAVLSRKGSAVVAERRAERERARQAAAATDVKGTALGNIMGIKDVDEDEGANTENGEKAAKFSDANKREADGGAGAGQSEFSKTLSLKEQREFLPAFAVREELLRVVRENQVTVVVGQTGSGKTTQLAQFLLEDGFGKHGGMIGCTQPRRVAAMSVAKRVSEEMGVALGQEVGYAIRFEDCTSPQTKIKFMTDGVLLRESLTTPDLDKYSVIIMDEAHERALNTDVLMGLIKRILVRRRDMKLIVTSATLNSARFSAFFGGAPDFVIPGRTFPVDTHFARSVPEDYVDAAVRQVLAIHVSKGPGDILVFMTGQEDIEVTCELVRDRLGQLDDPPPLAVLPIYSQMPADLQAKIFDRAEPGVRKVVVATNIAETSLTVDGIAYVVDAGFSKLKVYNPSIGMDALQITPISQANASQRAGRAGRTGPGMCFHLFTERAFKDELYPQTIPEIQRTNLANTVLLLKSLGVRDLLQFDFMDAPPVETITTSLYDLWALGALDNLGNLTEAGRRMTAFPMDPSLAAVLLASIDRGCVAEAVTIVAMLSVPSVFHRPRERAAEADSARNKFTVAESDHLTLLNVYSQWKLHGSREGWAATHFLHHRMLKRAAEVRTQIVDILRTEFRHLFPDGAAANGEALPSCGMDWDVVRRCFCAGYFHQAARARGIGTYINLRTAVTVQLHPTSALYGLGLLPDYVIYHELILTNKEYMSVVSAVDPEWLATDGGVFYSIKEKGYSERTKRVTEREFNRKAEIEAQMALDKERDDERRRKEAEVATKQVAQPKVMMGRKKASGARRVRVAQSDSDDDDGRVKKPAKTFKRRI